MNDDPIGNGYDFMMNVEKVTIQGDSFIFEERWKVSTLKGDLLRMITEYEFIEPSSPNAKIPIDFLDEMNFDQHASGNKSTRFCVIIEYDKKRRLRAYAMVTCFLKNPNEIC